MAQQYSSAPSYGAQYPAAPFYPPFNPSPGQQISGGTPTFQQPNAHHANSQNSASLTNTTRYDNNTHPPSQPAPLPFAPHFNPEFLKHFPPPPPPLPNAHFGIVSGTVPGFLPFPQPVNSPISQISQQGFPHFQQPPTPVNNGAGSVQNFPLSQDPRLQNQSSQAHDASLLANQFHSQAIPIQTVDVSLTPNTSLARSLDGSSGAFNSIPGLAQGSTNGSDDAKSTNEGQSHIASHADVAPQISRHSLVERQPPMQANRQLSALKVANPFELREHAKVALLSLIPHNIRYDDFLKEGVSPQILQQLYDELGLNWRGHETRSGKTTPTSANRSTQKKDGMGSQEQSVGSFSIASSSAGPVTAVKSSPAVASVSRASPGTGHNLERKDRIAQLLAAKAGRTASSGIGSKSQSPVSASGSVQPQRIESGALEVSENDSTMQVGQDQGQGKADRNMIQREIVKQKMEQLRQKAAARMKAEVVELARKNLANTQGEEQDIAALTSQIQQSKSLPTPVREQLVQNGFAPIIPGLFLTSAELDDDNGLSYNAQHQNLSHESIQNRGVIESADTSESKRDAIDSHSPSSHKRSLADDSLDDGEYPEAKRRAVNDDEVPDISMDIDNEAGSDASEGEIIDDGSVAEQNQHVSEGMATFATYTDYGDQHFLDKQVEIDTMRKRIIEMEQRQSLKRAQSHILSPTESIISTPTTLLAPQTIPSSPLTKDHESTPARSDERGIQSPISLVKATPEQIAERAAQLKAGLLRQKALRQKQLQEGLPALNDEVVKTETKLRETKVQLLRVRQELLEYEANIVRTRQTEEKLVHEVESLQKQISEGISGQRQFSSELSKLNQGSKDEASQPSPVQNNIEPPSQNSEGVRQQNSQELIRGSNTSTQLEDHVVEPTLVIADIQQPTTSESIRRLATDTESKTEADLSTAMDSAIDTDDSHHDPTISLPRTTVELDLAAPQGLITTTKPITEQMDESADDSDEAMEESDVESDDSRMSIDEETNDSASMSDSGSDDYEPAEPEASRKLDEKVDSDEYEPELNGAQSNGAVPDEEGDDYEPAEGYEPTEDMTSVDTPGVSTSPGMDGTPTALAFSDIRESNGPLSQVPASISQSPQVHQTPRPDDQEGGLQLSEADTLIKPQDMATNEETDGSHVLGANASSSVRYAPYQSPLSSFKSYRFHPLFNENVKDGYRSLTYSHKIDPKLPLCPSELNGVVCTDPQCQEQHFSSMALKDDKILVQMSSANDIKDKSLRDQYLLGLKQVIARLRQEGVKEFSAVADALSQYRRQWTVAQNGI